MVQMHLMPDTIGQALFAEVVVVGTGRCRKRVGMARDVIGSIHRFVVTGRLVGVPVMMRVRAMMRVLMPMFQGEMKRHTEGREYHCRHLKCRDHTPHKEMIIQGNPPHGQFSGAPRPRRNPSHFPVSFRI